MASSKFVSSWRLFLGCCIFCCVCLIITTPGVDALAFLKKPPIFLRSFLGLNLKINCSTDDPNATVSLFHRKNLFDTPVERTPSPNRVSKIGQVFYILNLIVHDAGVYTCKANNGIQSIKWPDNTGMTFLNSAQLPEYFVLKPDKPIIIRTGQEGKVVCESVGTSVAKLQWKKQVGPFDSAVDTLVPDSMVTEIKDVATNRISATLTISNAKQDDAGTYKCVLSVLDKSATKPVSVEVRDPSVPVIQPYTGPTTIEEGTEKFLKCTATAFPKPTITWYKDGQQLNTTICITSSDQRKCDGITYDISEDDLSSQIHSFGKLKIQSALYPRDQGEFKCVASNGFYSANLVIVLDVQAAPRLIKNLNAKLVKKDEESKVVCTVERSNPWPTFQWKYQAMSCPDLQKGCTPDPLQWKSIPAEPSSQVPTNQSVVTVARDVQNTFYLCQAINVVGNDSQVTRLVRTDIQKYIELDHTVATEFNERSIMRLPCIDRCFFMCSNIHFTRDGKKLLPENDARINVTQEQSDNARVILTIKNLTLNDSGNYRCVGIENPPLYDSVNITIKALKKPVIRSLIVKANYGKPVELLCPATANPPADITWSLLKDDGTEQTITESNDLGGNTNACVSRASGYFYLRAYDHSHLVICNPKHEDHSGRYTCHAENIAGSSSASALLDVYFAPTIITPSDGFRKTLDFGDELNVTCTAKANPHATVTWITNTTDQRQVLEKGVGSVQLFISSVDEEDYKRYKCVASNSYGTATAFLTVEKVGVIEFANDKHLLSVPAMVGIAVGVGVFVLLLLVVGCFLYRRQKKQMDEYKELYFLRNTDYKIDPDRSLLEQCNDLPYDPDWEFPEERLILGDVIGSGAFGQVIKAEAIGIVAFNPRDKAPESFKRRSKIRRSTRAKDLTREHVAGGEKSLKTPVAVKTLKDGAAEAEYKDLASELKILIHLGQHKNIINLLGACTRGKRLMVIMEFAPHGSFLSFIRAKREIYDATWTKTTNNPEQEFTLVDLAMAAYQISRGMAFLASKKCVHRDLAARNILVGSDYVMKIADFGLARDIYKNDLYVKTTSGLLPVKWMAPESLFDRVYTEKTDVWSFGILLWEAFTLGGTPYPGLPTEQLLDYLSDGKRMEMPARCPVELYTIMRDCWLHDPAQRPAFTSLNERLGKVLERNLTKDNPYIALQMAEEDEEEYGQGYYLQPCESGIRESKRYVESPVHTPDEEGTAAPRFDKGASEADWEDDTRYGSPLPPLPPGLGIISDDDMRNAPLPPIPASHQEPFSDKEGGDEFGPRRESGIELDYAADSGEYIGDLIGKSPDPSRDGSKPVAIQVDGVGKLPEVKSKGTGREEDETKV